MPLATNTTTIDGASAAATQTGPAISSEHLGFASAIATVAGGTTLVATIKIQGSNDAPPSHLTPFEPTNWVDVAAGVATSASAGSVSTGVLPICFRYVRAVYTVASGSGGTVTVRVHLQGRS